MEGSLLDLVYGSYGGASLSGLQMFSAGANIFSVGMSLVGGIMNASAQGQEARAQMRALQQEKTYNLGVLRQQKEDTYWNDMMSMWKSGLSTSGGTSATAVVASNQATLQRNIDFQERQYNIQIGNAKAASKRRFMGVF